MAYIDSILVGKDVSGVDMDLALFREYLAAREAVTPQDYGALGDGAADDSSAISDAIDEANGKCLLWPAGTYNLSSAVVNTFTGNQHWKALGPVSIVWDGSAVASMISLTTAGFNFTMEGPFDIDGDNLARECLTITDTSSGAPGNGEVRLERVKVRNAYSVLVGTGSDGIILVGGFRYVRFEECGAYDISRDAGVGVAGSQGSLGIGVASSGSYYTRQVEVVDCEIGGVTSDEADGDPANVDCDGFVYTGPSGASFSNEHPTTVVLVRGGLFYDNRGRGIKSQAGFTDVSGSIFRRSAEKSIAEGCDVDLQYGQGIVRGCEFYYNEAGGTPFGASFASVVASVTTATTVAGALSVVDNLVQNNYATASGDLPYFVALAVGAGATFRSLAVENNKLLGSGRVGSLVRASGAGNFSGAQMSVNNNYLARLSSHLINITPDVATMRLHASGNVSAEGTLRALAHSDSAGGVPIVSGHGNVGFIAVASGANSGLTETSEVMRALAYGGPGLRDGGRMCIESLSLIDDASGAFTARNYQSGIGLYVISANSARTAQGLFAHDGTALDLTAGVATDIAYGNGSNPDTDGKLNVWMDSGAINVRNRLGAPRVITLVSFG